MHDLAIVGAGTAGAALAGFAARAGLSVLLIERRAAHEAGARWVNGVPAWAFDEAGLPRPRGDELRSAGHAFHLVAGRGPKRIVMKNHGVLEVDMRRLVERLQARALDAGAEFWTDTRVTGFDGKKIETTRGSVAANVFVDASGLAGAHLIDSPRVDARDLCAAAQEVRRVKDRARAEAFFERHGVEPGDTLCFTGIAGGYSIVNVRLEDDSVSILTGSVPGDGHASGSELLAAFVREQSFIGEKIFGGSRAVPLRRPRDRIVHGRVALLGDSACQVFSAHGSGIGAGLCAARVLADVLARGEDLWAYAVAWQRRYGGLFAGYDAFRRFSQTLSPADVERMIDTGLLERHGVLAGFQQRLPKPNLEILRGLFRGALQERRLASRLAPALGRTVFGMALYARYPESPAELDAWSRRAAWLFDP